MGKQRQILPILANKQIVGCAHTNNCHLARASCFVHQGNVVKKQTLGLHLLAPTNCLQALRGRGSENYFHLCWCSCDSQTLHKLLTELGPQAPVSPSGSPVYWADAGTSWPLREWTAARSLLDPGPADALEAEEELETNFHSAISLLMDQSKGCIFVESVV